MHLNVQFKCVFFPITANFKYAVYICYKDTVAGGEADIPPVITYIQKLFLKFSGESAALH